MISTPRFAPVAVFLSVLGLVVTMLFVPPEIAWRRIDPVGYGLWKVRHASRFTAPFLNDVAEVEEPVRSWRALARAPAAESLFHRLAAEPNAVARLYGLAGLTLYDSAAASVVSAALLRDSTVITVNLQCREGAAEGRVFEVVPAAGSDAFVGLLLRGSAACP